MTRVIFPSREAVEAVKRKPMTDARKKRIHESRNGLCGICNQPVDMYGPNVVYDHFKPIWFGSDDAESDTNLWPLHTVPCNAQKTSADLTRIGKTKRLLKTEAGIKKPSRLKSRGFDKTLRKKMNGSVERKTP